MYTQAIQINNKTVVKIAQEIKFLNLEALYGIADSNQLSMYVVKTPKGEISIVPVTSFITFGFKSSDTTWFDIVLKK